MTQIRQLQTGLAAGISLPWSSVEAFSFGCKEFVWSRRPTVSMALTSVFDTTPPDEGGRLNCVWQHTPGFSSPPRISRSCPHCLRLWLDRGTIVGRYGLGKGARHGRFWIDVVRSLRFWAQVLAYRPHCFPLRRIC